MIRQFTTSEPTYVSGEKSRPARPRGKPIRKQPRGKAFAKGLAPRARDPLVTTSTCSMSRRPFKMLGDVTVEDIDKGEFTKQYTWIKRGRYRSRIDVRLAVVNDGNRYIGQLHSYTRGSTRVFTPTITDTRFIPMAVNDRDRLVRIIGDDDTIDIAYVLLGPGSGICTLAVAATMRAVILAMNEQHKYPTVGKVQIVSQRACAAFNCYNRAFRMNGYALDDPESGMEDLQYQISYRDWSDKTLSFTSCLLYTSPSPRD